jgi:hypothetical protein
MVVGLIAGVWLYAGAERAVGPDGRKTAIDATFFQPSKITAGYTKAALEEEVDLMRTLGITTVVVQWVAKGERRYYATAGEAATSSRSLVGTLLEVGSSRGIRVYLGLPMVEGWFQQAWTAEYLRSQSREIRRPAAELTALYGAVPAFAGWYLPYEFSTEAVGRAEIAEFFGEVSRTLKTITPDKGIMVSPFLTQRSSRSEVEWAAWGRFLAANSLSIVALQDGVGAAGVRPEAAAEYYRGLRTVTARSGRRLWAVVEVFNRDFTSAAADRVLNQLEVEGPEVDAVMIFDFSHYLNPDRGMAASGLFTFLTRYVRR